jgi:hypothetical protein
VSCRSKLRAGDTPVKHAHDTAAPPGQLQIVRDKNKRGLAAALQAKQEIDHLLTGLGVEVAGRFVGEDDLRTGAQGTSERDALLFAAGKLGREMIGSMGDADLTKQTTRRLERIRFAGKFQRQGNILKRGHGRHEMERLENYADVAATHERKSIFAQRHEILARDPHRTRARAFEASHDHQQRRFARTTWSNNGDGFPGGNAKPDALQDFHRPGTALQRQRDIIEGDKRIGHDR